MTEVVLRPCTVNDAEAVERLRVSGWQAAYRGLIPGAFLDSMPVDADRRRQLIRKRASHVTECVAVTSTGIAGWIAAGPCRDGDRAQPWQGEIYACYVLPGWWGKGIGRRLLAQATTALEEAGRADISLWVLEGNILARRFYEACRFRPDGKRQFLDLGEPVPEVRYQRRPASRRRLTEQDPLRTGNH